MKGKICGMRDDYDGKKKHVSIEVEHGRRKRSKGSDGEKGQLGGYDQKRSSLTVPRAEAAKYRHGQSVNVKLEPDDTPAPVPPATPKTEKARDRLRGVMR